MDLYVPRCTKELCKRSFLYKGSMLWNDLPDILKKSSSLDVFKSNYRFIIGWQISEYMMTSSNGNIFRVTGYLCGEFTGPRWIPTQRPVTRSFDGYFDLRPNKRLSKQSWGWWFETLSPHYDVIVMIYGYIYLSIYTILSLTYFHNVPTFYWGTYVYLKSWCLYFTFRVLNKGFLYYILE